jgi:hypothetical protein
MNERPWEDPDRPRTSAGRLRELLGWMGVPAEHVQPLDLAWLAENLTQWSAHAHYAEARRLCVELLAPDRGGRSSRISR